MKLVSGAQLAGTATCVQTSTACLQPIHWWWCWLVVVGGVASCLNQMRSCPPNDQLEVKACKTNLVLPICVPAVGKNKVHHNKTGRPAKSLDTMAKSPESAGGHRSFSDKPTEFLLLQLFSSAKRARAPSPGLNSTGGAHRTLSTPVSLYVK